MDDFRLEFPAFKPGTLRDLYVYAGTLSLAYDRALDTYFAKAKEEIEETQHGRADAARANAARADDGKT